MSVTTKLFNMVLINIVIMEHMIFQDLREKSSNRYSAMAMIIELIEFFDLARYIEIE